MNRSRNPNAKITGMRETGVEGYAEREPMAPGRYIARNGCIYEITHAQARKLPEEELLQKLDAWHKAESRG
jgi:hypothetical protein